MASTSEIFKGLRNAAVFERGEYLKPDGDYLLQINRCIAEEKRSGLSFIVEFTVLEAKGQSDGVNVNIPGTKASWFQGLETKEKKDVGFGAIKELLYAVLGKDFSKPEDKKYCLEVIDPKIEELINEAVDGNKLTGQKVRVSTTLKKTKKAGKDFTVHSWRPVG